MKNILSLLIFFSFFQFTLAQDCYKPFFKAGIRAYQALDFERALNQFNAARICDDVPDLNEIDEWISKTQSGYIDAIKAARDEALKLKAEAVKAKQEAVALRFFVKGQEREFKGFFWEAMDNYSEAIRMQADEILFREQRAPLAMSEEVAMYRVAEDDLHFLIDNGPEDKRANYYNDLSYVEEKLGNVQLAMHSQSSAAFEAIDVEQRALYTTKSRLLDEKYKNNADPVTTSGDTPPSVNTDVSVVKHAKGKADFNCQLSIKLQIDGKTFLPEGEDGRFYLRGLKPGTYNYEISGSVFCPFSEAQAAKGKGTINIRSGSIYNLYLESNKYLQYEMWISNY